jgi:hypothetical protein
MTMQALPGQPGWLPDPTGRFECPVLGRDRLDSGVMRSGQVDTDPGAGPSGPSILPDPPAPEQTVMPHFAPPAASDRFISLPAAETQARLAQMLPMTGVTLTQTTLGRIDGSLIGKDEPNVLVVLLLVSILRGLIHWYVKSRPVAERFSLVFVPVATGTGISIQGGPRVMQGLAPVMGQLPW